MKGLKELKKLLVYLASSSILLGSGFEYLNNENKNMLSIQKEIDSINTKKLKSSWIEPIVASYNYTKGEKTKSIYYKVSLSQPVFKSGGIYFAIKYATANGEFNKLSTSINQNSLIKRVYELVLTLKKLDLQISKAKLNLKNVELDIGRKRERFLSGDDDVSFLDQAMIKKNELLLSLEELKTSHKKFEKSFNNISPFNYKSIKLPSLELVTKKEFFSKNLQLKQFLANASVQNELKNMTISSYLPTVSLFGSYNYQKTKLTSWKKDEYKNYGVMVSMPFSINEGRDIEIRKLEALKAKLSLNQKKREIKNEYESILADIKLLSNKEKVTKKSLLLYKKLVHITKNAVKAGDKTTLDLKTVQNSKKSLEYDLKIIEFDKKLTLLKLFEKMGNSL